MSMKFSLRKPIKIQTENKTKSRSPIKAKDKSSEKHRKKVVMVTEKSSDHNPFKDDAAKTQKRKRTQYAVTPEKLNIIEIKRKINEKRVKTPNLHGHCELLYKLNDTRQKIKGMLETAKLKKEDSEHYDFKPTINPKSKTLAKNQTEDVVERNFCWLQERSERLDKLREDKEDKLRAMEELAMAANSRSDKHHKYRTIFERLKEMESHTNVSDFEPPIHKKPNVTANTYPLYQNHPVESRYHEKRNDDLTYTPATGDRNKQDYLESFTVQENTKKQSDDLLGESIPNDAYYNNF